MASYLDCTNALNLCETLQLKIWTLYSWINLARAVKLAYGECSSVACLPMFDYWACSFSCYMTINTLYGQMHVDTRSVTPALAEYSIPDFTPPCCLYTSSGKFSGKDFGTCLWKFVLFQLHEHWCGQAEGNNDNQAALKQNKMRHQKIWSIWFEMAICSHWQPS